jgi:hypothetical protein
MAISQGKRRFRGCSGDSSSPHSRTHRVGGRRLGLGKSVIVLSPRPACAVDWRSRTLRWNDPSRESDLRSVISFKRPSLKGTFVCNFLQSERLFPRLIVPLADTSAKRATHQRLPDWHWTFARGGTVPQANRNLIADLAEHDLDCLPSNF